jgi:hypothetical protein
VFRCVSCKCVIELRVLCVSVRSMCLFLNYVMEQCHILSIFLRIYSLKLLVSSSVDLYDLYLEGNWFESPLF